MTTRTLAVLPFVLSVAALRAQDPPAPQRPAPTAPVVVTATRTGEDPFEVPYSTSVLEAFDTRTRLQSRTTPEALKEIPGVSVQKTSHGQGSPKIRGQTGFQTLLLVDGIRLNDSTWRSGNVEYWNHLDPYSYSRFEVVRGPAGVQWGSDAVSGVGHALQKGRESFDPGFHAQALTLFRYASAEHSTITRFETQGNADDFGWHVGATYKDFDDLRAGRDVGVLDDSGYIEGDGDIKLTWRTSAHGRLSLAAQLVHLSDVPRTHSTVDGVRWRGTVPGADLQREHDHRRQLYWAKWETAEGTFYDRLTATVAWKERFEREDRVRTDFRRTINSLDVGTLGALLQLDSTVGPGTLVYGLDYYRDFVTSDSREFNADTSLRSRSVRGVVAGDADYDLLGVFAQYELPVTDRVTLLAGARYSWVQLDAEDVDVAGDSVTFDDLDEEWDAVTGSLRAIVKTTDESRVYGGVSQGFRAPNLSDMTRFDIARSGEQEVPSLGLDPEHYLTFELGARYDDGKTAVEVVGWSTLIDDQISRRPTGGTVNGRPEVAKANVGDGYLAGIEIGGSRTLEWLGLDEWRVFGFADYVDGRIDQFDATGREVEADFSALPPLSGEVGLRWNHPVAERGFEAFTRFAYHKHASSYTASEATNPERIPPDGLPGYAVYGLRGWLEVCPRVIASLAIENLTDVDYRIMDSGMNEPGTNVILTVQARL